MSSDYFCFDPTRKDLTVNTFVTAIRDVDHWFFAFRVPQDNLQPFKCCKTPKGYYIDYVSCYYMTTHDPYFEYYDSPFQFFTFCATGYVITGMAKKVNPYDAEWHLDWIQCCRVGFGSPVAHKPPVTYSASGAPVFYSPQHTVQPNLGAYSSQYRSLEPDPGVMKNRSLVNLRKTLQGNWSPDDEKQMALRRGMMSEERVNQQISQLVEDRDPLFADRQTLIMSNEIV